MGMLKEFKEFAMKGNVIDLAVGVVIGAAFGKIVDSMVKDVLMPVLGALTSKVNFDDLAARISVPGMEAPIVIGYGKLLSNTVSFIFVAFAVFMMIKFINAIHRKQEEAPKLSKSEELLIEIRDLLAKKV